MIDVTVQGSAGWWMKRLYDRLEGDRQRFATLEAYYSGTPPLAWGSEQTRTKFYRFQQMSHTNFAALLVDAPTERVGLRAIMTAADKDVSGDTEAWRTVLANDLDIQFSDATRCAFKFGRSYFVTSSPDAEGEAAVITWEDPRTLITAPDPVRRGVQRAAFKLFHDSDEELDVAILWLPGQKIVATRGRKVAPRQERENGQFGAVKLTPVSFSPNDFTVQPEAGGGPYLSESYQSKAVPVQVIENRNGIGEFELHTDLLDRLNHLHLMLMVIVTMQAFRQRVLEQSDSADAEQLPERDESGQLIDYSDLFQLSPDGMLLIPPGSKIAELGQADLTGILNAIRSDILKLAAVTRTPMSIFTPDGVQGSAEGAFQADFGMVAKVRNFLIGGGRALSRAIALGFEFAGDDTRSDPATVSANFTNVARTSLSEKGSAAAQAVGSLPVETIMDIIWEMDPAQIEQAKAQRMQELMVAQVAAKAAAPAPTPPVPPVAPVVKPGDEQPTVAA